MPMEYNFETMHILKKSHEYLVATSYATKNSLKYITFF